MSDDDQDRLPAERLRAARQLAGFKSASAAARAYNWGEASYRHHENGTRSFGFQQAMDYARVYNVTPTWLLGFDGQVDNLRVPIARFYVAEYAGELGEWSDIRTLIDDVHRQLGQVMIPELSGSTEFHWVKGPNGLPPFHFVDPSDLDVAVKVIEEGFVFACRAGRRTPRSHVVTGDLLFVDSSVLDVGTSPELWLMRDEAGSFVQWARIDVDGEILLLPTLAGESVQRARNFGPIDVIGRIIRIAKRP